MIRALLRDSFVYGLASIFSKGLALLLLPIYTRVLAPSDYGALDMIITFGALANLVVALEVSQGLARFWPECMTQQEKKQLASSAWWFSVVMYTLFLLGTLLNIKWLNSHLLGDIRFIPALRLGIVFIFFNGLFLLLQNQFRWELRSKEYAIISLIYSGLTLAFGGIFAYGLHLGLNGVLWGQIIATVTSGIIAWWLLKNSFTMSLHFPHLSRMLHFSAPLVLSGFATFISLYISRLVLNSVASLNEVGLFGVGSRIANVTSLLIIGIQGALTPLIYTHYHNSETPKQLARIFEWFLAIALFGCLGLSLFAHEILMLFTTSAYWQGAPLIALLAPALLLSQMYIFVPGIAIKKKTHWQLSITIITASASALLSLWLIPHWGVYGAALAMLTTSCITFSLWAYASQKLYPIPFHWKNITISVLIFTILTIFGQYLNMGNFSLQSISLKITLLFLIFPISITYTNLISINDLKKIKNAITKNLSTIKNKAK